MDELESQIAKIQLGNFRHTNSFVYVLAEKAAGSDAELFVLAELPLFNPAAQESCEKICLAIASTLKRAYKKPLNGDIFENAISQINEELGKLASLGQTHWIDKVNAILAVKIGSSLTIASCGKVSAFLYRSGEFTDISCSGGPSHPLKTFENYATGKIRLDDLIILSTTQLFNYLSMDRFREIVKRNNFLTATQLIIEILKENAGPEVAFGALLNLQVQVGQTVEEEVDLENYILEQPVSRENIFTKAINYGKNALILDNIKRTPKVSLPKISLGNKIKNLGGNTKDLMNRSKNAISMMSKGMTASRNSLNLQNFKGYSAQKKFFFISAIVLLLAFFTNLGVASYLKKAGATETAASTQIKDAQNLITNAQTSLLYKDETAAKNFLISAEKKLPKDDKLSTANKQLLDKTKKDLADQEQKMDKIVSPAVSNLGSLGDSKNLIKLPAILAAQVKGNIVSYQKQSGLVQDGILKSSETILQSIYITKNTAVIYNGKSLFVWDFEKGVLGSGFSQNVPSQNQFLGLAYYGVSNRAYTADKQAGQILSFVVGPNSLNKPVVVAQNVDLSDAQDLTIDTSVYVLRSNGLTKYTGGKASEVGLPFMFSAFSGKGKIYTDKDTKNFYILDTGANKIIIFDKRGNVVATLKSEKFTNLKDFQVDEKNKTIYVLNDSSLLKVSF